MAVILDEYGDVLELVGPPRWLQRLVIPLLARIGRARGLRASYAAPRRRVRALAGAGAHRRLTRARLSATA